MSLDARGSLWGRWDLHVHTPASMVHHYPGTEEDAWESFFADLEALPPEFKAIGINDYLFVDGYERVLAARAAGRLANIDLVLPVIELRLNVFGGTESKLSKANYHVLFSDQLEPQVIREQFLTKLSAKFKLSPGLDAGAWSGVLSRASLEHLGEAIIASVPREEARQYGSPLIEGFNNFTLSLDSVVEALQESSFLRGNFVTAVGKTEWSDVKWKDGSIADKKHVINSADCVFTAAESPGAYHKAKASLVKGAVNSRLLDCSDAHHLSSSSEKDRIGNCLTWLKADPTFGGLLQALEEFDHRVFVGEEPPQLRRVREHPSRYLDRVRVSKVAKSKLSADWFSVDLPLNPGLVAVIGNKGSGKSALAEVIGLTGGSPHEEHFSFLTDSRFRDSRGRLAENFNGELIWLDGESHATTLDRPVPPGTEARVQHLPQRYLESLCTEVPHGDKTGFDEELERIIFAHLKVDRRLGTSTLEELTEVVTGALNNELEEARDQLSSVNQEIAGLEEDQRPEVLLQRRSAYHILRREWYALRSKPPQPVPAPDASDPALADVRERLRDLSSAADHLGALLSHTEASLGTARRREADLSSFRTALQALERQHADLRADNKELLEALSIPDTVSEFKIDFGALDAARDSLAAQHAQLVELLEGAEGTDRSLQSSITWLEEELDSERTKLSAPEEAHEAYLKRVRAWKADVEQLLGQPLTEDPRTVLGARRSYLDLFGIAGALDALRAQRIELAASIHRLLVRKAAESSALYGPLQAYMDGHELPPDFQVAVGTSLVDAGFADVFLGELVNRHVAGSFCGVENSERRLAPLLTATDFDSEESVLAFLRGIDEHLRHDMREPKPPVTLPADQVRKGKSVEDVYDWIFGLSYLDPRYGLLFGGKPIYRLSPGEKGTLLLVVFLLAELDTRPLIIDQPEDNLDNNTVYRALVRCFQEAKQRRQVIIVTHNPNLAVVCDADQVVVATMDKTGPDRVTYRSGAIERVDTVREVVDILEGTQPAFRNRSVKYTMHLLASGEV